MYKWNITQISMLGHSVLHDIGFNRIKAIDKADVPGSSQRLKASRLCSSSKVPEAEFGLEVQRWRVCAHRVFCQALDWEASITDC